MPNLIKKVQNIIFQNNLFDRGAKIILAVSGGPDSCCLLDVFSRLQKKYSLELIIAHVNYNLRGKDSVRDEKFVQDLATKYNLEIFALDLVETRHASSLRDGKNISENYLREIRYDFFEKLRIDYDFDCIAVAHNADDQVETFLMRILRGSGMSGLSAMKFKNEKIIRPLLSISRKEILEYLKTNKLKYRTDKTNLENLYLRNKIRNKLIPSLEKDFNPKIKETIFDSLISISEDSDYLEKTALKNSKSLEIKKLEKLHPAILRRVLRNNLKNTRGDLKNISANNIEEIIKIIKSTKSKTQIVILPGLKITKKNDRLIIIKN
ncbi:MAG: tRNA(Ile)-lysidine synthase [Candidatus Moranbacteria bacterium GW2011_GWF2_36_839]|nr:MAG: tRNA(Ile)-lysidine synthase [Candidatus Moranbacteria bacterium GW2011_GWF1_36_78]KKQ17190.1 MAG: tRNA(Ile)-lysidine synthase [Candidatus Moranbacteria bacterium GW2011_GWF2_36_839]HAT73709.1 tRNA lysidine(34) synthetase TilS [Candidatus Moranbacteria bacterium]HBY11302.1 tRNA lysidine(34) synthetase TilS [Candidatus Moranbacteria bacterium]